MAAKTIRPPGRKAKRSEPPFSSLPKQLTLILSAFVGGRLQRTMDSIEMQALLISGPNRLEHGQLPVPKLGPGHILIETALSWIRQSTRYSNQNTFWLFWCRELERSRV
jgi:hypothetical protein